MTSGSLLERKPPIIGTLTLNLAGHNLVARRGPFLLFSCSSSQVAELSREALLLRGRQRSHDPLDCRGVEPLVRRLVLGKNRADGGFVGRSQRRGRFGGRWRGWAERRSRRNAGFGGDRRGRRRHGPWLLDAIWRRLGDCSRWRCRRGRHRCHSRLLIAGGRGVRTRWRPARRVGRWRCGRAIDRHRGRSRRRRWRRRRWRRTRGRRC